MFEYHLRSLYFVQESFITAHLYVFVNKKVQHPQHRRLMGFLFRERSLLPPAARMSSSPPIIHQTETAVSRARSGEERANPWYGRLCLVLSKRRGTHGQRYSRLKRFRVPPEASLTNAVFSDDQVLYFEWPSAVFSFYQKQKQLSWPISYNNPKKCSWNIHPFEL